MESGATRSHRVFGPTLLVAGTTIGAGMLALPLTSVGVGFWPSTFLLVTLWAVTCLSALVFLEIVLRYGKSVSIAVLAEKAFGPLGKMSALGAIFLLFHALLAAYIAGSSQILRNAFMEYGIDLSGWVWSIGYVCVFAFFVSSCTKVVDYANRFLFTFKVIIFGVMIATLLPLMRLENIAEQTSDTNALWLAIPIFFTSFGFHGSLPSLINYMGMQPKPLRFVIVVGSAIPLVVYFFWQLCTVGALTPKTLGTLGATSDISDLITLLSQAAGSSALHRLIVVFSFLAIATSFLGVAMGLFDVTAETFNKDRQTDRVIISLSTFLPPLIFALFFPHGFVMALGYAAIALSFLAILLPISVAWQWRKDKKSIPTYHVGGGNLILVLCAAMGIAVIAIEIWKKI